jgi:hypothetical protein
MGDQYLNYINQCIEKILNTEASTITLEELVACIQNQSRRGSRNVVEHILKRTTNYLFRDDNHPPSKSEDDLLSLIRPIEFRRYDPANDSPPAGRESGSTAAVDKTEFLRKRRQERIRQGYFDYEEQLQYFLSKNLQSLEEGLRLHASGYEYYTPVGRIDLLCFDREDNLVIIECKGGVSTDQAAGQLFRYMGWFEENPIQPGRRVRGIVVGRRIHKWLQLSTRRDSEVDLFEYELESETGVPIFQKINHNRQFL